MEFSITAAANIDPITAICIAGLLLSTVCVLVRRFGVWIRSAFSFSDETKQLAVSTEKAPDLFSRSRQRKEQERVP